MSKVGDSVVRCCNSLHRFPSLILCFLLILLQDVFVNFYLIHHLSIHHLFWLVPDLIALIMVIVCFRLTSSSHFDADNNIDHGRTYMIVWVTWTFMQAVLGAKVVVIVLTFATELVEDSFFGPSTLKTSIALGSCIFVLLITSQHDAPPSSDRRRYIEQLTGTVVFDILDTADIVDVLFDPEARRSLSTGLPETILFVAVLNLLLPAIPLITLSRTKFGKENLSRRLVYIHRLLMVLIVNVPNLILRMTLWHGFSVGISPFCLKNIIIICMTAYEFYEHKKEKFEIHKEEKERELQGYDDKNGNGKPDTNGHNGNNGSHERLNRHSSKSTLASEKYDDQINFDIENRIVTSM